MSSVQNGQSAEPVTMSPKTVVEGNPLCVFRSLRSVSYFPFLALRVTAADFNGQSFDGSPLVALKEEDGELLAILMSSGKLKVESRGSTDYAWFGIVDDYYNVTWAGPGDYIVSMDRKTLLVVPGPFYDAVFHRNP